jgi:hypothetical protein
MAADVTAKNYRETAQVIDDGIPDIVSSHGTAVTAKLQRKLAR